MQTKRKAINSRKLLQKALVSLALGSCSYVEASEAPIEGTVGNASLPRHLTQITSEALERDDFQPVPHPFSYFEHHGFRHRAGVFNVIHGGKEAVDFVCDAPDIKAISFVGGNQVGIKYGLIQTNAVQRLLR